MNCVDCRAFIPQDRVGYFIGSNPHLPVCQACATKARGGPPPPQAPVTTLYPGMYVGHFSDDKLLELLNYWPEEMRSELCGPDIQGVLWEVRRFAGTLCLDSFEYSSRQDGTKYYYKRDRRQGSIRDFRALIGEKHIRRDRLQWFPWYSYDAYGINGPEPLYIDEGMITPWGEVQQITAVAGGVYWVTTGTHGGFMLAVHRATQLLSQPALAIGELFGPWLCYEQDRACAVIIIEHHEWCHIFMSSDPIGIASGILQLHYPEYMQATSTT